MQEFTDITPPRKNNTFEASDIWMDMIPYSNFLFDLSVMNLMHIRLYTGFITGRSPFYHMHKSHRFYQTNEEKETIPMIRNFNYYVKNVPKQYWVSEPKTTKYLNMLGVEYKDCLLNEDVIRYQSCISNLYHSGIFQQFDQCKERPVIVEIGGGYGGLAHQIMNLPLKNRPLYVIIDLPEMLTWSAIYFTINNLSMKPAVVSMDNLSALEHSYKYDILFVPNYLLDKLELLNGFDLAINMTSFQEMTDEQIDQYMCLVKEQCKGILYSDNFRKHWINKELTETVSEHMKKHLVISPAADAFDHCEEDAIQRVNLLCKYIGYSPKSTFQLNPISPYIYGDNYKIDLKTGEVIITLKETEILTDKL